MSIVSLFRPIFSPRILWGPALHAFPSLCSRPNRSKLLNSPIPMNLPVHPIWIRRSRVSPGSGRHLRSQPQPSRNLVPTGQTLPSAVPGTQRVPTRFRDSMWESGHERQQRRPTRILRLGLRGLSPLGDRQASGRHRSSIRPGRVQGQGTRRRMRLGGMPPKNDMIQLSPALM